MAIRIIRQAGDPALRKKCREVDTFDSRLSQLIDDMFETMRNAEGVGLAAPQVGILKRVCVIDVGDGPVELVNPVIEKTRGSQLTEEACLSCPGRRGITKRPNYVRVRAQNRKGEWMKLEGKELLAKAFCHEIDHLDGILFTDKIIEESEDTGE